MDNYNVMDEIIEINQEFVGNIDIILEMLKISK